jgi:hypothetical protein
MSKNLLKYNDFVNEGITDFLGRVMGSLTGSKNKIATYVREITELERDFIDKTDELSFNIYKTSSRRTRAGKIDPITKQQELLNKRALETARRAKDTRINYLQVKISGILKKYPKLVEFYNKLAASADADIAEYAYNKAKAHRDSEYSNSYYSNFMELEALRKRYDTGVPGIETGEIDPIIGIEIPKPFNIEWGSFINYVNNMDLPDLIQAEGDGKSFKLKVDDAFRKLQAESRRNRIIYKKDGDIAAASQSEAEENSRKAMHDEWSKDFENKLELIKRTKLRK